MVTQLSPFHYESGSFNRKVCCGLCQSIDPLRSLGGCAGSLRAPGVSIVCTAGSQQADVTVVPG